MHLGLGKKIVISPPDGGGNKNEKTMAMVTFSLSCLNTTETVWKGQFFKIILESLVL